MRTLALVVVFVSALSGPVGWCRGADGDAHAHSALMAEVRALRSAVDAQAAELAVLRAQHARSRLDARRTAELEQLVAEVLADADTRASLVGDGLTAGHKGSFFLASGDGAFLLKFNGTVQMRFIADFRNDSGADDAETGFTFRRIELGFGGHVADPRIGYKLQLASSRDSSGTVLQDLIITYEPAPGLKLVGGRTKAPFMREELVSASRQLTVERSLVNAALSVAYVEGVGIVYTQAGWRLRAMVHDGINSGGAGGAGNDFQNDAGDIAASARLDLKLAGDWQQWSDFSAWAGEPTALFLGAAGHYELGETGDARANVTILQWTTDAALEHEGFNVSLAVIGRHVASDGAAATADYGIVLQGGCMVVPDRLEPFVRWEWLNVDDSVEGDNVFAAITFGANWYLRRDKAVITADLVWVPTSLVASNTLGAATSGLGLLPDGEGDDNQISLRVQFQLKF